MAQPLTIRSLRGGMNDTDPPTSLAEDQCALAQNVEWTTAPLGARRRGTSALTLPAGLAAHDRCTFLARHLPTSDESESELWALGVTGTASSGLYRKTSTWQSAVTETNGDLFVITGSHQYRWQAVTLHGKLFLAFKSTTSGAAALNRLHVWDGTVLRRVGLAAPINAPTFELLAGTNTTYGGSGATENRYYRTRWTVQSSGVTILRSEPSPELTQEWVTNGITWLGGLITRNNSVAEGATHWEAEGSFDGANWYVLGTAAAGTTQILEPAPYARSYDPLVYELSIDVGDYSLIPSARYLCADEDRLVWLGSFEDDARAAEVGWSPVHNADGVGNDERYELDTDARLNLNTYEGGPGTGLMHPANGSIVAFTYRHTYHLLRTYQRAKAYQAVVVSKRHGAIHGSVIEGVDAAGRTCIYFLDPTVGPCRYQDGAVQRCDADIRTTWQTVNVDAAKVAATAEFDPDTGQVIWNIAVSSGDTPTVGIVLHTRETIVTKDGIRRGWAYWTGDRCKALAACLYAQNIEANTTRSLKLKPLIALEGLGLIHLTDTGTTDNGTAYAARIVTRGYTLAGLLHEFGVRGAALLGKAVSGAQVLLKTVRDIGAETVTVTDALSFTAAGSETQVVANADALEISEAQAVQFEIVDVESPSARWELTEFAVGPRVEQTR